jgi:chaperone required for assembly of F1-ATPase
VVVHNKNKNKKETYMSGNNTTSTATTSATGNTKSSTVNSFETEAVITARNLGASVVNETESLVSHNTNWAVANWKAIVACIISFVVGILVSVVF